MSSYSAITQKTTEKDHEVSGMKIPYGWTYLKFDENKRIMRYDNYDNSDDQREGFETDYYIRRDLYYKDIDRLIRYRIEDQEKNHDSIYFDDIIEEFGDFDTIPQDDSFYEYDDGYSDSDESI